MRKDISKWNPVQKLVRGNARFIKNHLDKKIYKVLIHFKYQRGKPGSKWTREEGYFYLFDPTNGGGTSLFLQKRNSPPKTHVYDLEHVDYDSFTFQTVRDLGNGEYDPIEDVQEEVERLKHVQECEENLHMWRDKERDCRQ